MRMYEEHLKRTHQNARTITYDVKDLFEFLDGLADISCLMCVPLALQNKYNWLPSLLGIDRKLEAHLSYLSLHILSGYSLRAVWTPRRGSTSPTPRTTLSSRCTCT